MKRPATLFMISVLLPLLYPLYHLYLSLGVVGILWRSTGFPSISDKSANPLVLEHFVVPGPLGAEDLAIHEPSGKLVAVGVEDLEVMYKWWPPVPLCEDVQAGLASRGVMWLIDPKDWKATKLPILNFNSPLIPHGIGRYTPRDKSGQTQTYLHIINHPPQIDFTSRAKNPSSSPNSTSSCGTSTSPAADSVVEILKLDIDPSSSSFGASHIRTVKHPLVFTPNDVLPLGPGEFLITNDHINREGLLRDLEDILTWSKLSKGTIVHVKVDLNVKGDKEAGVEARVVLEGLHNPNGLAPGASDDEVLLNDAAGGVMSILHLERGAKGSKDQSLRIRINNSIQMTDALDNPSVIVDPYASSTSDMSGYSLAAWTRGVDLAAHAKDQSKKHPWKVYFVRQKKGAARDGRGGWEKTKIIEDDGSFVNGASIAAVVPIEPKGRGKGKGKGKGKEGKREAWVVLTSFYAKGLGVVKVDLTDWAKKGRMSGSEVGGEDGGFVG